MSARIYKVEVVAPLGNTKVFWRALTDNGVVNGDPNGVPRDYAPVFLGVAKSSVVELNTAGDVVKVTVEYATPPPGLGPLPAVAWWANFTP